VGTTGGGVKGGYIRRISRRGRGKKARVWGEHSRGKRGGLGVRRSPGVESGPTKKKKRKKKKRKKNKKKKGSGPSFLPSILLGVGEETELLLGGGKKHGLRQVVSRKKNHGGGERRVLRLMQGQEGKRVGCWGGKKNHNIEGGNKGVLSTGGGGKGEQR